MSEHNPTIVASVISAVSALFGGFIGSVLSSRNDHSKWLREGRSSAFVDFHKQLDATLTKAQNALYSVDLEELARNIKVSEAFVELRPQQAIVRMYLSSDARSRFSDLMDELWRLHDPIITSAKRAEEKRRCLDEIALIFEKALDELGR